MVLYLWSKDIQPWSKDVQQAWSGQVQTQVESPTELQRIFGHIHGCGIEVNGLCYIVEVFNPAANLHNMDISHMQRMDKPTLNPLTPMWVTPREMVTEVNDLQSWNM